MHAVLELQLFIFCYSSALFACKLIWRLVKCVFTFMLEGRGGRNAFGQGRGRLTLPAADNEIIMIHSAQMIRCEGER